MRQARSRVDGNKVAVKILHKGDSQSAYIEREKNSLVAIGHPNIIRFIEVFESENNLYLVLELYKNALRSALSALRFHYALTLV